MIPVIYPFLPHHEFFHVMLPISKYTVISPTLRNLFLVLTNHSIYCLISLPFAYKHSKELIIQMFPTCFSESPLKPLQTGLSSYHLCLGDMYSPQGHVLKLVTNFQHFSYLIYQKHSIYQNSISLLLSQEAIFLVYLFI